MPRRNAMRDVPRGQLLPLEHTAYDGTPFFDEDLQVPQSEAHRIMVYETGSVVAAVAEELGLRFLSDQPIWYLDPDTDLQRAYYGDWVVAEDVRPERITARDLRLVVEIVSSNERKKEIKDTVFQRALNEYNEVPEFGLVFPEVGDSRALHWFTLEGGRYHELVVSAGGQVEPRGVPGLALRVRPQSQWSDGRKIDVLFRGELRPPLTGERARAEQEHARAEQERARAEQERARAEQEHARAEQERARAERLAARLAALGQDPDAEP